MDEYSILKKKQKKNAFVATALLISIAIALLVMVGAVLVLSKVNDNDRVAASENDAVTEKETKTESNKDLTCEGLVKEIVFNDNLTNIKEAAIAYFTNERLPQTIGDTEKISLGAMVDKKLIREVHDASANSCSRDKSYVEVTKEEDEYVMKINLSCSDIEDYIIVHLGCYDYCDKDVCEKKEDTQKTYEYEYKKTTSCVMSDWSNWGEWKLTREKTSNLKKEDIKVETSTKEVDSTIDATANIKYNCDKYPGYTLVDDKCVKKITVTDTIDATASEYSYNCDKYSGYTLVGKKCVKETANTEVIDADKTPTTYSCPSGYTLNGTKCNKTTTVTDTIDATTTCPSGYKLKSGKCTKTTKTTDEKDATITCPKGYKLKSGKCTKTTTVTDTKEAEPVYKDKIENYTCYKQECTTKVVFKCPTGKPCGNYPETSCESVKDTCQRKVQYISDYKCPDKYTLSETEDGKYICTMTTKKTDKKNPTYTCPSGYTLNGKKCSKTISTTDIINPTYTCPSGYTLNGTKCTRITTVTDTINATEHPGKYTCPSGYALNGTKCTKTTKTTDEKDATRVPGGYVCPDKYTLDGKKCTKTTTLTYTKNADKTVVYTCPSGYTLNGTKCTKKGTETIKTTYYRYATRTCNGGSTDYKWSESKNDSSLISEGYKLTGKKRELIVK